MCPPRAFGAMPALASSFTLPGEEQLLTFSGLAAGSGHSGF